MELQNIPIGEIQLFLICLARVGSLMATMPIFTGGQTPKRIRTVLALGLSIVVFPVVAPYIPHQSFAPVALGVLVMKEAILGLLLGFVAQLLFTAVEFGGTIIGYQMGFAVANVFDPQTQRQISLMSQFQNVLAILIFLSLDIDHLFLRAIVDSYRMLPVGHLNLGGGAIPYLMHLGGDMFSLGIKFSAPVLAVLMLSGLVLGVMSRIFPQLNVFMLSFPINIGASFLVIGLTLGLMTSLLGRELHGLAAKFVELFRLLS